MLKGKRVVVVGLGLSGVAAGRLCLKRGARVVGVDRKALAELGAAAAQFVADGGEVAADSERDRLVDEADVVIVSPGVPPFAALSDAERRGAAIWSEVELATRELARPAPIVAVGGTNGKSTTTSLLGELFIAAGMKTFVGGNLGEPLSLHVDEPWDVVVLEVSSFQMERVDTFHARAAILLNVTPDHLDRYDSFHSYAAAKGNAFRRQGPADLAVVPFGDEICLHQARRGGARLTTFGAGGDIDVTAEAIVVRATAETFAPDEIALTGAHNAQNVAAALAVAFDMGVSSKAARQVLASFSGLAHRMAFVRAVGGVRYYDDSKGTNVGASVTALLGVPEPKAVLIAGGVDKGGSYAPLAEALSQKGRAVVLMGQAAPLLAAAIGQRVPVHQVASMNDAVKKAQELAQPGDCVLLSPACSSFDMFRDYKDRGDAFVRAVKGLGG